MLLSKVNAVPINALGDKSIRVSMQPIDCIYVMKETKLGETRVALTPANLKILLESFPDKKFIIQSDAGKLAGHPNEEYLDAGLGAGDRVVIDENNSPYDLLKTTQLVLKVKEPINNESSYFQKAQTLFCFLHLASSEALTRALLHNQVNAIGFETVEDAQGRRPLLDPMSILAGEIAVETAKGHFNSAFKSQKLAIVGAGKAGGAALEKAISLGVHDILIVDSYQPRLDELKKAFPFIQIRNGGQIKSYEFLKNYSSIVLATRNPQGGPSDKIIDNAVFESMKRTNRKTFIVDIAVDEGGATSRTEVRYHDDPYVHISDKIILYCVANMPSLRGSEASKRLSDAMLPFLKELLSKQERFIENPGFLKGVQIAGGHLLMDRVATQYRFPSQDRQKLSFFI